MGDHKEIKQNGRTQENYRIWNSTIKQNKMGQHKKTKQNGTAQRN
jgi:hypothetical protein